MDRRTFIKSAAITTAIPAISLTCKYEDDEKGPEKESSKTSEGWKRWDYRVYCYERQQGEWTFSQNIKGSFAYQREYMTLEEDEGRPYTGWMDGGKLHFASLDGAIDFVDCHARAKDDINLIDSIYDIYYVSRKSYEGAVDEREIKVAHYWFNGDSGRQIHWVAEKPYTDWNAVEFG